MISLLTVFIVATVAQSNTYSDKKFAGWVIFGCQTLSSDGKKCTACKPGFTLKSDTCVGLFSLYIFYILYVLN